MELVYGFFSKLLVHSIQNISLVVWASDPVWCAKIRRSPSQVDFVVGNGLHYVSWMVLKVEKATETRWLAAGNKWIIACKMQIMCIEMFQDLNLSMNARSPIRPSVIVHKAAE
jgi:hypothetical protein